MFAKIKNDVIIENSNFKDDNPLDRWKIRMYEV